MVMVVGELVELRGLVGACFFFLWWEVKMSGKKIKNKTENVVEQQDGSGRIKGTKSWIALSAKGWQLTVKEKGDDLW